jgi:hypothetical protein
LVQVARMMKTRIVSGSLPKDPMEFSPSSTFSFFACRP